MELDKWPDDELVALGDVYLRHKQFARAAALRLELAARVEAGKDNLRTIYARLDPSNVVSITDRLLTRLKKKA